MQSEIDDHVVEAVGRRASSSLVGVHGSGEVSSGVAIDLGGRFFIATVEHHLRNIPDGEIVLVHTDSPTSDRVPILRRFPEFEQYEAGPDLGFVELSEEVAGNLKRQFISIERLLPYSPASPNLGYVVTGYPSDMIPKELSDAGIVQFGAMSFGTSAVHPRDVPESEVDRDVFLKWVNRGRHIPSGRRIDSPHPGGMSGCGIWGCPTRIGPGLWDASQSSLVGIAYSYLPERGLLRGYQIQHWINRVGEFVPEIRPIVESLLHP